MAITDELQPATEMFAGGFSRLSSYAWLLIPIILIVAVGLGAFIWHKKRQKDGQWTHTLRVRRVLQDGRLTDTIVHRMRRFPIIKNAEVFELETPLLGGYLLPELDEYSGHNQFSIILDKNNRIYTNKGEFFKPDSSSVNVSAKHSEIDIERSNLRSKYQNINSVSKRIEWSTIAKYAMMSIAIIAVTIIAIVSIQKWGDNQEYQAAQAQAEARAMEQLNEALEHINANDNTQLLLVEKLKELYETRNIQAEINKIKNES